VRCCSSSLPGAGSRRRPSYGATLSIFPAKRKALGRALPTCVYIPRRLAEELERRGIDVESYVVDLIVRALGLDPRVGSEAHLELALRYLEEGRALVDRDPVRASEKLYKASEEVVRALAIHFNLGDILRGVSERGRWSAGDLEKAAIRVSDRLGEWFRYSWDSAWALHVWGFHEAKLDSESVRRRVADVERMVLEARSAVHGGAPAQTS